MTQEPSVPKLIVFDLGRETPLLDGPARQGPADHSSVLPLRGAERGAGLRSLLPTSSGGR